MADYGIIARKGRRGSTAQRLAQLRWAQLPRTMGAALWLDPTWGVFNPAGNPAAIGDKVATWVDRAAGIAFAQATDASRPTLQVVNGRPMVRFDGVDDVLSTASSITPAGDQTAIISVATLNSGASNRVWSHTGAATNGGTTFMPRRAGLGFYTSNNSTAGVAVWAGNVSDALRHALTARRSGTWDAVRVDGVAQTITGGASAFQSNAWTSIGGGNSPLEPAQCDIYGLLLFGRGLTDAELSRVERYLSS